jgi:hypothetical protein
LFTQEEDGHDAAQTSNRGIHNKQRTKCGEAYHAGKFNVYSERNSRLEDYSPTASAAGGMFIAGQDDGAENNRHSVRQRDGRIRRDDC